jgi:hypothetical protein
VRADARRRESIRKLFEGLFVVLFSGDVQLPPVGNPRLNAAPANDLLSMAYTLF